MDFDLEKDYKISTLLLSLMTLISWTLQIARIFITTKQFATRIVLRADRVKGFVGVRNFSNVFFKWSSPTSNREPSSVVKFTL